MGSQINLKPNLLNAQSDTKCESLTVPTNARVGIRSAYKSPNEVSEFNYSQIITYPVAAYCVTRSISDGMPVNDFKCSNVSAGRLAMSRISKLTVPVNHCW